VVLLDEMMCALEQRGEGGRHWRIGAAKFVKPVRPGERLSLEHERLANGSVRFSVLRGREPVAHGLLVPVATETTSDATSNAS
jgi:3-hydroxymyristoyl/3-hydroxydecanoyl-(acyl carrier protein) dehydratase